MNIYIIRREDMCDYDEYDSHVIAANDPAEACKMAVEKGSTPDGCWKESMVVKLGEGTQRASRVILSSFNAG